MADAATTRPRHLHLGSSALNPKGCSTSAHTHHHPTGETNTHVIIYDVDVCFGFEQCDGDIGTATTSSHHQRRLITLRTHNDTERQSKCAGIPHMTRTLVLALTLALALTSAMAISVWPLRAASINGVPSNYEHTMILGDSPSVRASLV